MSVFLQSGLLLTKYEAHVGTVKSVKFFRNTKAIASCAADGAVCYDLNKNLAFRHLKTE